MGLSKTTPEEGDTDVDSIPTPEQHPTMRVPEAGRLAFGLGYAASYEAAKRGDLPTIKVGRRLFVPTAELRRRLGLDAA